MKITNLYNLPEPIYRAVSAYNRKPIDGRFSVSDLITPPLVRILKMKHWTELQEDASERLWALLGQSVHYILGLHEPMDGLAEEKISVPFDGVTLTGRIDLWHNEEVSDYKVTSVYSFLLGEKPEWVNQLNVYAYLYMKQGFSVKSLKIYAILRDWQKSKLLKNGDYPAIPFQTLPVPLWSTEETETFIKGQLQRHLQSEPVCTPEEMWQRPTTYAVMKTGRKTAVRVFPCLLEAEKCIDTLNNRAFYIEDRYGVNIRCQDYCPVRTVCDKCKVQ